MQFTSEGMTLSDSLFPNSPRWRFDAEALAEPLALVHRAQGHLMGRMAELGVAQVGRGRAALVLLLQNLYVAFCRFGGKFFCSLLAANRPFEYLYLATGG